MPQPDAEVQIPRPVVPNPAPGNDAPEPPAAQQARELTAEEKLEVNVWVVSTRIIRMVFIVFFPFSFFGGLFSFHIFLISLDCDVFVILHVAGLCNVIMYRRLSLWASGVCCWFYPVCTLGFLVVTSFVVRFLGYTLELFCTVCDLLVIVNRVNDFYVYTVVVWIGLLWPVRQIVICLLLSWRDSLSKVSVWWSWLLNVVWPVKNVIYLLLS